MEKDDNHVKEISEGGLRKDALYLFDSSPDVGPKSSQTVCFCNPNPTSWVELLRIKFKYAIFTFHVFASLQFEDNYLF